MKCVLITGATSGIGEVLAQQLARSGVSLILTGRNAEKLAWLKSTLGVPVTTLAADLAIEEERQKVVEIIRERVPDVLILNAGFGVYGESVQLRVQEQLTMIQVNCSAVVECALEGAKALLAHKKQGTILNVASAIAYTPAPLMAVYAATKAFVLNFSIGLDLELQEKGIRVLVSLPGQVGTDFARRAAKKKLAPSDPQMTAEKAAKEIIWQIKRKKRVHVFDLRYRLSLVVGRLVPATWVASCIKKAIAKRL